MTEQEQEQPKPATLSNTTERILAAQAFWGIEIGDCHDAPVPSRRITRVGNPSYVVTVDRESGVMTVSSPDLE